MTPAVARAIDEIRCSFPECRVEVEPDASGGAYVFVHGVPLGAPYTQDQTWFGFHITFQYPYADVYPHFVRPDLCRLDGRRLGEGTGGGSFRSRAAIQLSRRSNRLNPATDTAALKLLKVIRWLLTR